MTQANPVFNVSDFELRNYTNPYLSEEQQTDVSLTETRVNEQLDFLAQMLGWNGPNYWEDLPSTPNQKRQLLGGTFGVYNSYIIPKIYEIRNWDNTIVVDPIPEILPGRVAQVARVVLGEDVYEIQSAEIEGDKIVVSLGELQDSFYTQIADGVPLKVDIPSYRPAPFYREKVGVSGDYSFNCISLNGTDFSLFPAYDAQGKFPFGRPVLFQGSVYYFNQPVYVTRDSTALTKDLESTYDAEKERWFLKIPSGFPVTAYLVWNDLGLSSSYSPLEITVQSWTDPSDWGSANVLDNFTGTWGNKGGALPFNFSFDSLSLHGSNEEASVFLNPIAKELDFNEIINYVYYQRTTISDVAPADPREGDLWWNEYSGALAVWLNNSGCGNWVEIEYRQSPRLVFPPSVSYPDVAAFQAAAPTLPTGTYAEILDITGLSPSDNIIGLQGTLTAPGRLTLHGEADSPYWVADEFTYNVASDFETDALLLPFKVPVRISDGTGLAPSGTGYEISNLPITISGEYEVLLAKYYTNTSWELYPDTILKFIAFSALFGSPLEGQQWWDYLNTDPNSRTAAIFFGVDWVAVNNYSASVPPAPTLNPSSVLFYSNDTLLTDGTEHVTPDYSVKYEFDSITSQYRFTYTPITFTGSAKPPKITISDSITTTYRADISEIAYSGATYTLKPNVYNAETPLRLWKSEALQVADTVALLDQDNYTNPFLADINSGPGPENWEKYFVRLPLEYERNGDEWQKVALVCQDFAYWGSNNEPEEMRCPPQESNPIIWEELFIYDTPLPDYTYVYTEPYLYSNIGYPDSVEVGSYRNAGVYPGIDIEFDEFDEAALVDYDPLHSRQADVKSPVNQGYGDWLGTYVNVNPCEELTGYYLTDLENGGIEPVAPPVWDASIYKFAPRCPNPEASYNVDSNHYKIGYSYFVADASAAEDAFFDISQEIAWRYPVTQPKTGYVTPR